MQTPSHRRWFQFGLKGLFAAVTLLAVFLGWVSWELDVIRQRKVFRAALEDQGAEFTDREKYEDICKSQPDMCLFPRTSHWRDHLGDPFICMISLPEECFDEQKESVVKQFPEAIIYKTMRPHYNIDPARRQRASN